MFRRGVPAFTPRSGLETEAADPVATFAWILDREERRLARPATDATWGGSRCEGTSMSDKDRPEAEGAHTTVGGTENKTDTPKIEGSHTQETVDPAERLPEDPDEQNDLA